MKRNWDYHKIITTKRTGCPIPQEQPNTRIVFEFLNVLKVLNVLILSVVRYVLLFSIQELKMIKKMNVKTVTNNLHCTTAYPDIVFSCDKFVGSSESNN